MKCLRKYQWVKLPRDIPDMGKGLMAYWAMLAFRAAFRQLLRPQQSRSTRNVGGWCCRSQEYSGCQEPYQGAADTRRAFLPWLSEILS